MYVANKPRRASGSCRPLCRLLNSGGGGMLGKEKLAARALSQQRVVNGMPRNRSMVNH